MIYRKNKLKEISFPLGGIGTGSVGLAGNGALIDWEIFNRPNKGSKNGYSFFAVKAQFPDGKSVTKILQGDHTKNLVGQYGKVNSNYDFGFGPAGNTLAGFPHFKEVTFDGKFPIATLTFQDDDFPAKIELSAFNPFIPLDADNSGIPAAFFEIKIKSFFDNIKYTVIFSVGNPFSESENEKSASDKYTAVQMRYANKSIEEKEYGDLTIAVNDPNGLCQEYWYRGEWQDAITTFWNELSTGTPENRHYEAPAQKDTCSVGTSKIINSKETQRFCFVLSWSIPNNYNYWSPYRDKNSADITWKNYYATLFHDSAESCFYCFDHWEELYRKTKRFCGSLHTATLDKSVIDFLSAHPLAILGSDLKYILRFVPSNL